MILGDGLKSSDASAGLKYLKIILEQIELGASYGLPAEARGFLHATTEVLFLRDEHGVFVIKFDSNDTAVAMYMRPSGTEATYTIY